MANISFILLETEIMIGARLRYSATTSRQPLGVSSLESEAPWLPLGRNIQNGQERREVLL